MAMSESLMKYEIDCILYIQDKFKDIEPLLELIGRQCHPTNAQFIIGPFLAALTGESLTEMMLAMTFSDFISQMMKWLLREDRPFWWVHETHLYTDANRPKLRHHPLTCRATAGGPSGHSSIMTVILYLHGRWLVNFLEKKTRTDRDLLNCVVFTIVSVVLILTWISGAYFGSYFFHQGVTGTTLALSVLTSFEQGEFRQEIFHADRKRAFTFAIGAVLTAATIYIGMVRMDIDPMWSVRMAFKWCDNIDYLKPEFAPIYNLVKSIGSMFGIALCAPLRKKLAPSPNMWKSVPITVCFLFLDNFLLARTPKDHGASVFLIWVFGVSLFHSYAMIELVPKLANWGESPPPPPPNFAQIPHMKHRRSTFPRNTSDQSVLWGIPGPSTSR